MSKKSEKSTSPSLPEISYPLTATYTTLDGIRHAFHYRDYISIAEVGSLVTTVVINIMDDEYGYCPHIAELVFCNALINYYTDINIKNIDEIYELMLTAKIDTCDYNFKEGISRLFNEVQIDYITIAIRELIEHRKHIIENKTELDYLANDVRLMLKSYDEKITKSLKPKTIEKFFTNINSAIETYVPQFAKDKPKSKSKVQKVDFAGQQKLDGTELKTDEIK